MFVAITVKREWADDVVLKVEGPFHDFVKAQQYKHDMELYYRTNETIARGHDGTYLTIMKLDKPDLLIAASVPG